MSISNPTDSAKLAAPRSTNAALSLPRHILVGYWHNWHNHAAPSLRLRDVVPHFDVIHVAFAVPSKAGNGEIVFKPHVDAAEFKADILELQRLGKKILISIGGAAGSLAIEDIAARHNFVDSVTALIQQYNFDGIDINLEGKVSLDPGDVDFRNPTSPAILHLIMAIREIRDNFGTGFVLSMAPEAINVQAGLTTYAGLSGSYLPLVHELRDILTWLQVQHYNSGSLAGLDGRMHQPGTADFHAALADMLLDGFPVHGHHFPSLQPEQIVLGMGACPQAVNNGYTDPHEVQQVLSRTDRASLRGVMTWSINWDAASGHHFSRSIRSYLNTLQQ